MLTNKENSNTNPNVLVFSPPQKQQFTDNTSNKLNSNNGKSALSVVEPSMLCARFQGSMYVEFGTVAVNSCNTRLFKLINPNKNKSVTISVDRISEAKGFSILLGPNGSNIIEIPGGETGTGVVTWNPTSNISAREVAILKLDDKAPLQMTVTGVAGTGKEVGSYLPYHIIHFIHSFYSLFISKLF